jgi:acyl carrier protein
MLSPREVSNIIVDNLTMYDEHWTKLDSLAKLEVISNIEDDLDINIPLDKIEHIRTEWALTEVILGEYYGEGKQPTAN